MIIAVDFDGTLVEHEYPQIGCSVPFGFETLAEFQKEGHQLILWTVRIGKELEAAVQYCRIYHNIVFWGVNENPTQKYWNGSPKAYAQMYIDDAALGCPLIHPKKGRPFVDWLEVRAMISKMDEDKMIQLVNDLK